MNIRSLLVLGALLAAPFAHAGIPAVPAIPLALPDTVRQPLIAKRQPLALRKLALIDEGKAINSSCASVQTGSSQHQNCLDRLAQFNAGVEVLRTSLNALGDEIDAAVLTHTVAAMRALAVQLKWNAEEQARLDKALHSLNLEDDSTATAVQVRQTWQDILARAQDPAVVGLAAQGSGPAISWAGTQTRYDDCAVFALANAAGVPYDVAAVRATKLISEGEWREPAERANPQQVLEQGGLNGGEVVMLAEAFGQVEVVRSTDFARTLKEGRGIMVSVVPQDGDLTAGHEVVLSRTFQRGGEIWYEMLDSNQGSRQRLYLSAGELGTVLQESGVVFRPDPGSTPAQLR